MPFTTLGCPSRRRHQCSVARYLARRTCRSRAAYVYVSGDGRRAEGMSLTRSPLATVFRVDTERTPIHPGRPTRLRELGYDEIWLQNWLVADPSRLGLGDVTVVAQEQGSPGGGNLDILVTDVNRYFSVEVQLGEVDASHSFRVFDYWARNRLRYPDKDHVAVLIVESAGGRYRPALDALATYVPLVVIELRAWRAAFEAVIVTDTVVKNESVDIAGAAGTVAGQERTEADWRAQVTPEAWAFYEQFHEWAQANLGQLRVNFAPKSYVGLNRGRRVWAPLWFRKDGAYVYLPDPDGLRGQSSSPAFEAFEGRLEADGVDIAWQPTYNAGSNPVAVRLTRVDLGKPSVQELLAATFRALETGVRPWSEVHGAAVMEAASVGVSDGDPDIPGPFDDSAFDERAGPFHAEQPTG